MYSTDSSLDGNQTVLGRCHIVYLIVRLQGIVSSCYCHHSLCCHSSGKENVRHLPKLVYGIVIIIMSTQETIEKDHLTNA